MPQDDKSKGSLVNAEDLFGLSGTTKSLVDAVKRGVGPVLGPLLRRYESRQRLKDFRDWVDTADEVGLPVASAELSLSDRADVRLKLESARKQENREAIACEALLIAELEPDMAGGSDSQPLSLEFVHRFWKYAEEVSQRDLQTLWARVLQRSASKPSQASLWLLDTLSKLDGNDALALESIASCVTWNDTSDHASVGIITSLQAGGALSADLIRLGNSISTALPSLQRDKFGPVGIYVESGWAYEFIQEPSNGKVTFRIGNQDLELHIGNCSEQRNVRQSGVNFGSGYQLSSLGRELFKFIKVDASVPYIEKLAEVAEKCGARLTRVP